MTNINNNNEIVSLEKEIESIDDILDWSSKIKKIKVKLKKKKIGVLGS